MIFFFFFWSVNSSLQFKTKAVTMVSTLGGTDFDLPPSTAKTDIEDWHVGGFVDVF